MKESYLYKKIKELKVSCNLCNHKCVILNKETGKCNVRKNIDGSLFSINYGHLVAENVDPIEKKPLFHFLPGSYSYSIASAGCNFSCFFCQNYEISQVGREFNVVDYGIYRNPEEIVEKALRCNCKSISYTYTEPTVFFEYAYDTAIIAQNRGIKNVFVTNGYMTKNAIDMIAPYLDAANIDLKSFSDNFYKKYIGARLKPVLDNIRYMKEVNIWIEVTTLLIPGLNDSKEEIKEIASFLKDISPDIPWHISAYFPRYKSLIKPTEPQKIIDAVKIGKESGLSYVYGGNIMADSLEDTVCPACGKTLIRRIGYNIANYNIDKNCCAFCKTKINGIF